MAVFTAENSHPGYSPCPKLKAISFTPSPPSSPSPANVIISAECKLHGAVFGTVPEYMVGSQ